MKTPPEPPSLPRNKADLARLECKALLDRLSDGDVFAMLPMLRRAVAAPDWMLARERPRQN